LERVQYEDKVVWLVNMERVNRNLSLLKADERLRVSARFHSADMAKRGFFAHIGPQGSPTPLIRMLAAGVDQPGGENIAMGQESPASVVDAWMHSPPHRQNILSAEFRTIGVGVHPSSDGLWWTQNFGY
jgi:uncharacterized protein YkwD